MRSASSLSPERERERERLGPLQTARSSASQGLQGSQPPSPSVMTQSMQSEEDTTSGSTRTQTHAMWSQAPSQVQVRLA
jgi:hypothetical protein